MTGMKSVTCDASCGFMVRSRDEKEVVDATKNHVRRMHKQEISDKDVRGMMKSE
jgi:predicted small metal-binding protein